MVLFLCHQNWSELIHSAGRGFVTWCTCKLANSLVPVISFDSIVQSKTVKKMLVDDSCRKFSSENVVVNWEIAATEVVFMISFSMFLLQCTTQFHCLWTSQMPVADGNVQNNYSRYPSASVQIGCWILNWTILGTNLLMSSKKFGHPLYFFHKL